MQVASSKLQLATATAFRQCSNTTTATAAGATNFSVWQCA